MVTELLPSQRRRGRFITSDTVPTSRTPHQYEGTKDHDNQVHVFSHFFVGRPVSNVYFVQGWLTKYFVEDLNLYSITFGVLTKTSVYRLFLIKTVHEYRKDNLVFCVKYSTSLLNP